MSPKQPERQPELAAETPAALTAPEMTRRRFLTALGVGAAALGLPASAEAVPAARQAKLPEYGEWSRGVTIPAIQFYNGSFNWEGKRPADYFLGGEIDESKLSRFYNDFDQARGKGETALKRGKITQAELVQRVIEALENGFKKTYKNESQTREPQALLEDINRAMLLRDQYLEKTANGLVIHQVAGKRSVDFEHGGRSESCPVFMLKKKQEYLTGEPAAESFDFAHYHDGGRYITVLNDVFQRDQEVLYPQYRERSIQQMKPPAEKMEYVDGRFKDAIARVGMQAYLAKSLGLSAGKPYPRRAVQKIAMLNYTLNLSAPFKDAELNRLAALGNGLLNSVKTGPAAAAAILASTNENDALARRVLSEETINHRQLPQGIPVSGKTIDKAVFCLTDNAWHEVGEHMVKLALYLMQA